MYFGRSVSLNLALLALPLAVWFAGSLLAARFFVNALARSRPRSSGTIGGPLVSLYRFSVGRRPWPIANGAVVVALIVALAVSLGAFTASYDAAKRADARYATGSDLRITPSPTAEHRYGVADSSQFAADGIAEVTPVIYAVSNVILRSARTSDPANLAAVDPTGILLSEEMAAFLKAQVGDRLHVLLARATPEQVEVELHVIGLYQRLPGFPEGADAVMSIDTHAKAAPTKAPDFFLTSTRDPGDATLARAYAALSAGPGAFGKVHLDTRLTTLARDQSSLAALNIAGLLQIDRGFALAMAAIALAIFAFGLLLQRRREYVTLRAQGLPTGPIRALFVLPPRYTLPWHAVAAPLGLVLAATAVASLVAARLVSRLDPTELLRDDCT